jgi:putative DNA primase/helicase
MADAREKIAVELTRITKDSGAVTKRIHLDPDDTVRNDSSRCAIGKGRMTRLRLSDWRALAGLIEETPRNTAYALGALRPGLPDSVQLVRKRDPQGAQPGVATRTAGVILYKSEPSFVLCDFDTKGMPPDVEFRLQEFGGFRWALEAVCPAIAAAGHVSRRSTSANLVNKATGKAYPSNGAHLYLLVQDGTDARRFLYALHDRCWLARLGWYIVGKAGQLLERSIADRMVFAPERLVFEASPDLEPPLKQEKREATVHDGAPLDTMATCANLDGAEHKELQRLKATAARALGKEIAAARETFVSEQVEKAVSRGMDADKARHMAQQWGVGVLLPGAILEFDDPDLGAVSVDAILADPHRYDGETLADPVEGIAYGRNCAIVQVRGGIPSIYSFAHGSARYELRHDSGAQSGLQEPRKGRKKRASSIVPSEDILALDFAGRHGDELRFVSLWGKWLKWTAERWQVEKTLAAFDLARKICHGHSLGALRAKTVAAIEQLARSDRRLAATTDQWDADPWLFNTPAGTVELKTGNLREHRPQDYITKIAGCAPGRDGCPMFFQFLNKIFDGDRDLIDYLQKFFGYILTGLTTEHAMLFFHGAGANGKSVLVSTIAGILGEHHRVAPIDTFTATGFARHSTDLAGLMGARLVTANETEEGAKWAEAKLKALTGGDKITAQFMRQDYFDYVPAFKLVITGNHKPGLQSVDEAMRRRLNLIPFNVTIPKADRDQYLAEKLKTEWPGILAWMIDGCLLWQEEGRLNPPQAVIAATDEYLESEDAMATWISERCELKASFEDTAEELFKSWKAWAELMRENVGSAKAFSNKLQARAGIKRKEIGHSNVRGYSGIRVVNVELAQSEQSSFSRDD